MRRKLVIGWILFLIGALLQVVSDIADMWIIGVFGGIIWPVGIIIGINASKSLDHKKQEHDSGGGSNLSESGNK